MKNDFMTVQEANKAIELKEASRLIEIEDREMLGPGRPIDGAENGDGEKVIKIAITVWPDQAELAEFVGGGNRSRGFRYLVEFYRMLNISTNTNGMNE